MESLISNLLSRFEKGSLSRRDLVQGLAMLAASGSAASAQDNINFKAANIDHISVQVGNLQRSIDFYQKMFDWPIDEHFQIAEAGLAGHLVALGHEPYHYTMFYVQVDDVAQAIAKAESLGGKKVVGPVTIPPGTFAWIMDTEQNMIGLWKPK